MMCILGILKIVWFHAKLFFQWDLLISIIFQIQWLLAENRLTLEDYVTTLETDSLCEILTVAFVNDSLYNADAVILLLSNRYQHTRSYISFCMND